MFHSSDLLVKHFEVMKQLMDFPIDKVFPCIDLYRVFLTHPQSNIEFTRSDMGASQMAMLLGFM